MGRGAWRGGLWGHTRIRQDLVTKQQKCVGLKQGSEEVSEE